MNQQAIAKEILQKVQDMEVIWIDQDIVVLESVWKTWYRNWSVQEKLNHRKLQDN